MQLKDWMNENRWTNRALASELGVHEVTIGRIRAGAMSPRLSLARRIVELTDGAVEFEDLDAEENGDGV